MSSGGHIGDMVSRYKSNRKMLKHTNGNNYFNLNQSYRKTAEAQGFVLKDLSEEEMDSIRKRVRDKIRKENIRKFSYLAIGVIVGLPITWFIIKVIAFNMK